MVSSTLVFAIIIVGGITRLTESGLSITEWRPVTGILPPLTHEEWVVEFDKYKGTPEFKMYVFTYRQRFHNTQLISPRLNSSASLDDFKFIYSMEWGHRILGRLIGVVFVGPLVYFAARKKISGAMVAKMSGLAALIGVQGLLGWYMVQSGLEESIMETPGAVPRVSQYRLAAHLGTAIALYAGMFGAGLATIKDWKFSKGADWSGVKGISSFQSILSNPSVRAFKVQAWTITGLVFLTALSGEGHSNLLVMLVAYESYL
jgi:cytochrome c oxidase assembly protein subunit 15